MSWLITGSEKIPTDPQFGSVSLLLHGDGTNGSTAIIDSSPFPKTVTAFGSTQISTAQSKFGGASIATGTGTAQIPASSAFDFTGVDFTIEFWLYFNQLAEQGTIFTSRLGAPSTSGFVFYLTNSLLLFFAGAATGGFNIANGVNFGTVATGQWYNVALTRSADTWRLFLMVRM